MKVTKFTDGIVICGTFPDEEVVELIRKHGKIRLSIADPPYGNIVKNKWDKIKLTDYEYAMMLAENFSVLESIQDPGHVTCWWGGIGKYKFRPFFKLIPAVEENTNWQMVDLVTWKKRRGYGIQNKYLFIREELAYFCLGGQKPEIFNVPYLDVERGYPGYNKKYPAKSKYLRRGNVWTDIGELLRGKTHDCEKPTGVSEVLIKAHTNELDTVLDLYSGSGSCSIAARGLGRKFIAIENDEAEYSKIVKKLSIGGVD